MFLAAYTRIAVGRARLTALLPAILVWLLMSLLINSVRWTPLSALALNGGALTIGILVTRRTARSDQPGASAARATRRDLAGRALAVALFVASLLALSAALGPSATGILATFPIVFVVLIFVLRPCIGDAACAVLAATALRAMGGFGLMFLVVHLAVVPLDAATGLALSPTLAWSAVLAYQHGRRAKPRRDARCRNR